MVPTGLFSRNRIEPQKLAQHVKSIPFSRQIRERGSQPYTESPGLSQVRTGALPKRSGENIIQLADGKHKPTPRVPAHTRDRSGIGLGRINLRYT